MIMLRERKKSMAIFSKTRSVDGLERDSNESQIPRLREEERIQDDLRERERERVLESCFF